MNLQMQKAIDARWDLACERLVACRISAFIRERAAWRPRPAIPMPVTSITIRSLIKSALVRVKGQFAIGFRVWDRTPERILIGVAARVFAETSGVCPDREFKRWISDFAAFEKGLS